MAENPTLKKNSVFGHRVFKHLRIYCVTKNYVYFYFFNFRANLRLGIHFLSREDPSRAILSLQSVLRTEPSNIDAWEILADAYFARGSFNAALRAYDQVKIRGSQPFVFLNR